MNNATAFWIAVGWTIFAGAAGSGITWCNRNDAAEAAAIHQGHARWVQPDSKSPRTEFRWKTCKEWAD